MHNANHHEGITQVHNIKHTANFLASSFLSSKRSQKKIYGLDPSKIGILRYICDSIDKSSKSHRKKLFQSQIAKFTHCSLKTTWRICNHLIKKRFLLYDAKKYQFSVGKVLITYVKLTYSEDIRQIDVAGRCTSNLPTSNSSNFTKYGNRSSKSKNQKPSTMTCVENQSTSAKNITKKREATGSPLLEEYMAKKGLK